MSKKFKDIKKGDTLYCVNPSWESDKCTITKWTVTDVYDAVSKDELIFDVKEKPTPTFALREATSVFDLVFTSEEDSRDGMIRQINHSIAWHKDIIKKYKEQLKKFTE